MFRYLRVDVLERSICLERIRIPRASGRVQTTEVSYPWEGTDVTLGLFINTALIWWSTALFRAHFLRRHFADKLES